MRTLTKELQYYKKRNHLFDATKQDEEISKDNEDTMVILETRIRCEECTRGFYEEFEIMDKCFGTCNICEHRKRLK